jgi:hypothetical protein
MDNKAYFITIYDKLRCDRVLAMDKNKPINDKDFDKMMNQCIEQEENFKKYQYFNKKIIERP